MPVQVTATCLPGHGAAHAAMPPLGMRAGIRYWRRLRGLTQEQLAERVGITAAQVSRIETGDRDPALSTLEKIAEVLDCSLPDLLTDDPSQFHVGQPQPTGLDPDVLRTAVQAIDDVVSRLGVKLDEDDYVDVLSSVYRQLAGKADRDNRAQPVAAAVIDFAIEKKRRA